MWKGLDDGKVHRGREVPGGLHPRFLFVLPKRKRAVHGPKEKTLGAKPCTYCARFGRDGVLRIGPAGIGGPVVPAPSPGGRRAAFPHNDCGARTGWASNQPASLSAAARLPLDGGRGGGPIWNRPLRQTGKSGVGCTGAARSEAERAERGADQIRPPSRSSTAPSVRPQGLSTAGKRRRVGGAIDARRTDSPDPRASANKPRRGRFSPRRFSFVKTKENGCIPRGESAVSSRAAGEKRRGGDAVAAPIVRGNSIGNAPVIWGSPPW